MLILWSALLTFAQRSAFHRKLKHAHTSRFHSSVSFAFHKNTLHEMKRDRERRENERECLLSWLLLLSFLCNFSYALNITFTYNIWANERLRFIHIFLLKTEHFATKLRFMTWHSLYATANHWIYCRCFFFFLHRHSWTPSNSKLTLCHFFVNFSPALSKCNIPF